MDAFDLPEPPDERLEHSPLSLVVWQLRYDEQPAVATPQVGVSLHAALGGREGPYPLLEEMQSTTVQLGPPQVIASQATQRAGWRMSDRDRNTAVVFAPDALTIETSRYGRWPADFSQRIAEALEALCAVTEPVIEQRLGLRYVDRIVQEDVKTVADWRGLLRSWAIAGLQDGGLDAPIEASEVTHAVRANSGNLVRLRIATFPDGDTPVAILDVDASREGSRQFDREDVLAVSEELHQACKQLFYASIEPKLYEALGGTRDSA